MGLTGRQGLHGFMNSFPLLPLGEQLLIWNFGLNRIAALLFVIRIETFPVNQTPRPVVLILFLSPGVYVSIELFSVPPPDKNMPYAF